MADNDRNNRGSVPRDSSSDAYRSRRFASSVDTGGSSRSSRDDFDNFDVEQPSTERSVNASAAQRDTAATRPFVIQKGDKQSNSSKQSDSSSRGKGKSGKRGINMKVLILIAAVAAVAALACVAVFAFARSGVKNVAAPTVSDVTADSVTLSWQAIEGAEGYRVFSRKTGEEIYVQSGVVSDPSETTFTVTGLEQASEYSFYVTAFTERAESKDFTPIDGVWTSPAKVVITSAESTDENVIYLKWEPNEKAAGFCIEYRQDTDGSQPEQIWVEGAVSEGRIDNADPSIDYIVTVAAYTEHSEKVLGEKSDERFVEGAQNTAIPEVQPQDFYIDPNKPMIALTFDDGPLDGTSGDRILDVLERYNAKATFFMVGCNIADHADNLIRKVNLGMEIGNHTWNHKNYGKDVTVEDIRMACNEIYNITGMYPDSFRSPGGMTTDLILNECAVQGMPIYHWSIDTNDWSSLNASEVYKTVMDHVTDGDIILMHEIYDSTAEAVERLVPVLIHQGYQLVTCHDLVLYKTGAEPVPGQEYKYLGN